MAFLYDFTSQKEWREDYYGIFKKKVKACVKKSQDDLIS